MDKSTFYFLIDKYLDGTASPKEKALLDEYYNRLDKMGTSILSIEQKGALKEEMYRNLINHFSDVAQKKIVPFRKRLFFKVAAAAAIFAFFIIGSYFFFVNKYSTVKQQTAIKVKDLLPGKDAAMLTLANGKKIMLDSISKTITDIDGISITSAKGLLSYQGKSQSAKINYNIIITPRGGQYQLLLADGSKVWLNSGSTLKYPTDFTGTIRQVELSGEGYFEIAKDVTKPFQVKSNGQMVEVLGTHFNINSYDDETEAKTTLLEGSIRLTLAASKNKGVTLKPGEQGIADRDGLTVVKNIDAMQIMAWQKGLFEFNNTSLPVIMRQISRWYNVDVVYKGKLDDLKLGGTISRNLPLSEVLKLLEDNKVKCKLDGQLLIVTTR